MIDVQQAEVAAAPVPVPAAESAVSARRQIDLRANANRDCAADTAGNEVVVCGRSSNEAFRLRPLPPLPPSDGLLSRPLRVQLAPGISLGFQRNGGFGLKAEFGPGKKADVIAKPLATDETATLPNRSPEPSNTP